MPARMHNSRCSEDENEMLVQENHEFRNESARVTEKSNTISTQIADLAYKVLVLDGNAIQRERIIKDR